MKFNKKVYVIPEDKYHSMVRNRELRDGIEAERGSVQLQGHPAHSSEAQDEARRTLSSVADEMSGAPKTHSPEDGKAVRKANKKMVADMSGKLDHDSPDDPDAVSESRTPGDSGDPGDPEHDENADNENTKQGKMPRTGGPGRDTGKDRMVSPRAAQEDMVRRTLFTLLKPRKRGNLMKVYAGLFSNNKSTKPTKALVIPGLPARDLFLALLHTQCERSARPDNYKPLYSRLLLNKVPLTYIGNKRLRRVLHYLKNRHSHRTGGEERPHPTTPSKMAMLSKLKDSKKLKNEKGKEKPHARKNHNAGQRESAMQNPHRNRTRRGFKEPWIRI